MKKEYFDERFCDNCEECTPHICKDEFPRHERDASYDTQKCLICKWKYCSIIGKYEPPLDYNDQS